MLRRIQITHLFSPELSVWKKKMRCIFCSAYVYRVWSCFELFCFWVNMYELFNFGLLFLMIFQVHLIRLSSDDNELICEGLFSHPDEIWDLASCPYDQRIFSTVFSSGKQSTIFSFSFLLYWFCLKLKLSVELCFFFMMKLRWILRGSNMANSGALWPTKFPSIGANCFP